ncbi:hypothetical protein [Roseomonas populi]|uniref:Uncharacterized protein n=1 Tax=Roseomonas populi TaxID=3121582 RepID=A0ABT1XBS7_9PROT|nr:hypothetical protein [Roseomonas pecuniae]MCR0985379.1 hypothetical protein [Roseomonas pecuniae]
MLDPADGVRKVLVEYQAALGTHVVALAPERARALGLDSALAGKALVPIPSM